MKVDIPSKQRNRNLKKIFFKYKQKLHGFVFFFNFLKIIQMKFKISYCIVIYTIFQTTENDPQVYLVNYLKIIQMRFRSST